MFDWKDFRTGLLLFFATSLCGLIWTLIVKFSKGTSFVDAWKIITSTSIYLPYVVLLVFASIVVTYRISRPKVKNKMPNATISKREQLKQFNSLEDPEAKILAKWIVYFFDNGKPFISDVDIYCTNHPPMPLKLMNGRCTVGGCKNNEKRIYQNGIENHIQSAIDHEWDRINKVV